MKGYSLYTEVANTEGNDLVIQHAPLVKRIANHMSHRLPSTVQFEDLVQSGMIGLLEAAQQYDPSQGAAFESYASIRIRGAMLDEIRRGDWTPRSVHRKAREVSETVHRLEHELGREVKDFEVCEAMGISISEYHRILKDVSGAKLFSYDQSGYEDGEPMDLPDNSYLPAELAHKEGFKVALAGAIGALPEREKLFMALYYDEELNLKEIGLVLGVSESRVSQIHGQAMVRIRGKMQDWIAKDE